MSLCPATREWRPEAWRGKTRILRLRPAASHL